MIHGGDLISYQNMYNGEIVDFSSNINPLGPPDGLKDVLNEAYKSLTAYPDIKYRRLKENISTYLNCSPSNVVVGNGAVEIINNFVMMFKRVVVFTPCFLEYMKRGDIFNKEVLKLPMDDKFEININLLNEKLKEDDIVILGNPNNPTGKRIKRELLLDIYKVVLQKNSFLLLDEAFFEFSPADYDSIEIFKYYGYKNVGIIRAATKFFALPGIRLGYGCTGVEAVEKYQSIELPWSVNAFADAAGSYIFSCIDYIKESKEYIKNERSFLISELSKIKGINVFESQTNFILIKLLNTSEDEVFKSFIKNGIMIRKCSSFIGLDEKYIRIAVKSRRDNLKLINCFKELI